MSEADASMQAARRRSERATYATRLAELVVHLTDCAPERALAAVEATSPTEPTDADAALEVVARAMVAVRRLDLRDRLDLTDAARAEAHTPAT